MKIDKKEKRITVRLTPNQNQVLKEIATKAKVKKSAVIRCALNQLIKQYNDELD